MAAHPLARGGAVLGSAPWPVLLPLTALAGGIFGAAVLARHDEMGLLLALVAIGMCGAVAGYVLDEEAREVADATPTSRPRRAAWRAPIALLPVAVSATALTWVTRLTPETHALRMLPIAAGSVALGMALAAAMRRAGSSAPGELAGVLTFGVVILVVLVDPLHRWVSLRALDGASYPLGTALTWAAVVLLCASTVITCERDPGGSRRPARQRKDAT